MDISSKKNKILVLLPDGVGLRNFIYTVFLSFGDAKVWTSLDFLSKELDTVELPSYTTHKMTDVYKSALVKASILYFHKKYTDDAYLDYIFPSSSISIKNKLKNAIIDWMAYSHADEKGLEKLREKYLKSIRKSSYFEACTRQLEVEKPSFVFCTNQRMINAAAPMSAAQELGIPTATFIFSWDNMPKGNLSVPADHLFVWSAYMKAEAKKYYPYIKEENVHIVGTPQFIPYTDKTLYEEREVFCERYDLDSEASLICFSGDDVTTSPYDPLYLEDTAKAVQKLNASGTKQYQIVFRRCPTDVSGRYDEVLKKYSDIIKSVDPLWEKPAASSTWNAIIPTQEDVKLLVNTVLHCDTAINVGSTIAHDFACLDKTTCYFNYNPLQNSSWDIHKIYKFIHFKSMERLDPIYWVNNKENIAETLLAAIEDTDTKLPDAKKWLETVVLHPLSDANNRIWQTIESIVG